ncbi:carboxypeptidase regulatory-like domain-containing protein, partial [Oleiphilus sp. HI0123]
MHAVKLLLASLLCLFSASVFAAEQTAKKENLFIFVFKEGVAQSNINVKVGDESSKTDEFGVAAFTLPAGDHEVGYYKGGELFALTDVALLETVSSQVFLNLTNQGESVELDLPLSAYEQDFDHQDVKPQTGPKGNLIFSVRDSANDAAVSGAKLFFKGYAIDAITDEKGIATVELAAGDYDISVIHPKYVMQVSKDVSVRAETDNEHAVKLIKADIV